MRDDEIKAVFEQQAEGYDARWTKTAPIRDALLFLTETAFAALPDDARLLCVGAGTGEEIAYFAARRPGWRFVAVEPAGAMATLCQDKAQRQGFGDRCEVHEGYLASLPEQAPFDAATSFLVSQFILDERDRIAYFGAIAQRLRVGGLLACADLSADVSSPEYEHMLGMWLDMLGMAGVPAAGLTQMREAYARDVAILPPSRVSALIESGGFTDVVAFHQAGLIRAWRARRR